MRLVWTLSKARKHLNLSKVASQLTRLSMQGLSMVKTSGAITMKRAWLFLSKSQLKILCWQAHAHFSMCHLQRLMKNLNQQSWTTLPLRWKNWMKSVTWMLSAMAAVQKHLLLTKNSLRLNVLVKMQNFVRGLLVWQTLTTLVCQPLQNVRKSSTRHSICHRCQLQQLAPSLKLRKSVLNVWPSARVSCQQKTMTSS